MKTPDLHFVLLALLSSFFTPPAVASTVSYDSDGDGLIEIDNLAQLNASRWDLDGDGAADNNVGG